MLNLSWESACSQEKLKTTVYAKFGGQIKCVMGDVQVVNYVLITHVAEFKANVTVLHAPLLSKGLYFFFLGSVSNREWESCAFLH